MSKFRKIGLFLSSFLPLFLLIIIKELIEIFNENWTFNFLNTSMLLVLVIFIIWGCLSFYSVYNEVKVQKSKKIRLIDKTNLTDKHFLGYFSLFVLFAITFEIEMYSMAVIFFIVLFLIGVVYIKNDMYYINPLINLLGFSFYDIEYETERGDVKKARVFYKGRFENDFVYLMHDCFYNFIFINSKQEKK